MFTIMASRWFYLSEKFLIGRHPGTGEIVLLVRQGEILPTEDVTRVLKLNDMVLDGPLKYEEGQMYYNLKEVKNDKAT